MCYFNSVHLAEAGIVYLKGQALSVPPEGRDIALGNGFAYGQWPVVVAQATGDWRVEMAHWEFLPEWVKAKDLADFRKKYNTLNAKAETALSGKMFRAAALHAPCLVLSSGFYEWRHLTLPGQTTSRAYPYYVHAPSAPVFFMAGVQTNWVDQETGECLTCFAILTRAANAFMEQVHNTKKRMPLVLSPERAEAWLVPDKTEDQVKELLTTATDDHFFQAHPVRKDFRQWANPQQIENYPELPPLVGFP